ncbi:proteinaceous RNase P 2 [Setaria viridis]|nr:proteinaceous RNase P 2 [Setaria viridis]
MATTTRRRPRRGSKGSNPDLSRTLTDCTRRGDAAAAIAAFDDAVSDPDAPARLAAHQYNQLLHLLATADRSSFPSAAAAARRVFAHMLQAGAPPSEATITSLARVTAAPDADNPASAADEAFELVATMREKHGLAPRLRSYSPVLAAFRRAGDASKAYAVEAHMAASGVSPEEPELAALLDISSTAGDADKVYEYMHKLRQTVDCVTEETAQVVEGWFSSDNAGVAGKAEWDAAQVKDAIVLNGGGCHRLGWLGTGPWTVQRVRAGADGQCAGCKCQLACVDIDMEETQRFADAVAALALERETKANFSQFQEWLEENKEYEAIVDGANIALYQQNFAEGGFSLTQLDAVITELRGRYHGKWPLVILHNKRIAKLMENSSNRHLIETWRANGALYTTPSGSNDDWYWLYAAIKLNCLLVTNDEMRDHIFELLGSSFFPKWKHRHRVKYTFNKGKAVLVMPPPYSSEIQESEVGSWHVPLEEKSGDERVRIWLCIGRTGTCKEPDEVPTTNGVVQEVPPNEESNGVQQSLQEDKAESITGKRKDRD